MDERKPGYIWYSFGSDKTGPSLAEAIGYESGKKTPDFSRYSVIVGWGCKPGTKYDPAKFAELVASGQLRVLNHPEAVQRNRNKLLALKMLAERNIPVPGFVDTTEKSSNTKKVKILDALAAGAIAFPLVGLTKYGKGEPRFCYTFEDVERVVVPQGQEDESIPEYFRTFDQGATEYRIHVFRDEAIAAEKKRLVRDPVDAISYTLLRKLKRKWEKEGVKVSAAHHSLVDDVVRELSSEIMRNASHLKRSTSLGWTFGPVEMKGVSSSLAGLAIEALDALELDIGAVNLSVAEQDIRVLSVTTAPALDNHLPLYGGRIQSFSSCEEVPAKKLKVVERKKAPTELMARLTHRAMGASAERVAEALKILEK